MRYAIDDVLRVLRREFLNLLVCLARINVQARRFFRDHIAQHALSEIEVLVDQRWRGNRA